MIAIPHTTRRAIVAELIDVGNLLDACLVRLFKADVNPGAATVLADLTPADYPGYAPSTAVVWGAVFTDVTGAAVVVGDVKEFPFVGAGAGNSVFGYAVYNGANLRFAERFDQSQEMTGVGDNCIILPRFSFGQ